MRDLLACKHGQETAANARGKVFTTTPLPTFHYNKPRETRALSCQNAGKLSSIFWEVRKIG
jgi:hypothetical protein